VLEAIKYAAEQPAATAAALRAHREVQARGFDEAEYKRLEREVRDLEAREAATVQAQIKGLTLGVNASIYEEELRRIALQRTQAKNALNVANARRKEIGGDNSLDEAQLVAEALKAAHEVLNAPDSEVTDAVKQSLLSRVVESIYPTPDGRGCEVNLKSFTKGDLTVANVLML
jgi:hypothetical protein